MRIENVSEKKPPKTYRGRWLRDWYWDLEPSVIGQDPLTNKDVCWGDGVHICCRLKDNPYLNNQDIPF